MRTLLLRIVGSRVPSNGTLEGGIACKARSASSSSSASIASTVLDDILTETGELPSPCTEACLATMAHARGR